MSDRKPTHGDLAERDCVPCRGGVPPLDRDRIVALHGEIDPAWSVVDDHHLARRLRFSDFRTALDFVVAVGEMSDEQGHHPEIRLGWGRVELSIHTHAIDGLTESDFVWAAKADRIARAAP